MKFQDLTGHKFNRMTVIRRLKKQINKKIYYLCKCDCGVVKKVAGAAIKNGSTKSCGCWQSEQAAKRMRIVARTHGESHTQLYRAYRKMVQRCHWPQDPDYKNYGGRGITVCKAWRNNFLQFKKDMGPRPDRFTVERIDNNKGYTPKNCRWASCSDQNNNKRSNKKFTFRKETLSISQWAKKLGTNKHILWRRIFVYKWPIQKVLTEKKPSEKTHCKRGHIFKGRNLLIVPKRNGKTARLCRECVRASQRRLRKKERAISKL